MKKIDLDRLNGILNPFLFEENPAIALATDGEKTNGLTIGWASLGILWNKPTATVYVHKQRFSKPIFDGAGYFSICFPKDKNQLEYFGTVSGKNEDKIKNCGLTLNTKEKAPFFEESTLVIICKIMGKSDFDADSVDSGVSQWYKRDGVHTMYYGEIIKVLEADS